MVLSPTEGAIRDFFVNDLLYDQNADKLGPDDYLLQEGMLDSLGIVRTVAFCEETFGISIPDEEVLPQHFETIRAIAGLVERQLTNA